jgi:hypothetical protein
VRVDPQHPLNSRYLQGIPVSNRFNVTVDWKGNTPGVIEFELNGLSRSIPTTGSVTSYSIDMGVDLRPGTNSLRITARTANGQRSNTIDFAPYLVSAPTWLGGLQQAGLLSLPLLASGDLDANASYTVGFHLPNEPFDIDALRFGVPDADTDLEWGIDGRLELPMDCTSPIDASITASGGGFKLFGTKIDIEGSGGLRADRVSACAFEMPYGFARFEVEGELNVYRKPVLVMVTYFNAAVGVAVDQIVVILNMEELVGKLGEFYVDANPHFGGETKISFTEESPYFKFRDLQVQGGLGIEGGFRSDLKVVEVKVWAGADGSIEFMRMGPVAWPNRRMGFRPHCA